MGAKRHMPACVCGSPQARKECGALQKKLEAHMGAGGALDSAAARLRSQTAELLRALEEHKAAGQEAAEQLAALRVGGRGRAGGRVVWWVTAACAGVHGCLARQVGGGRAGG